MGALVVQWLRNQIFVPARKVRHGEAIRVYFLPLVRIGSYAGFLAIFVGCGLPLFSALRDAARHGHTAFSISVLVGYILLLGFTIYSLSRVGVEVSSHGVKSVSLSRKVSLRWSEISSFEVVPCSNLGSCVAAKCRDGSTKYLGGLARWTVWKAELGPCCHALNEELRSAQTAVQT